jgi:acyl-CoA synthetase (NDP forming)
MLEARSVALVGASPRPGSLGERMISEVTKSPARPEVYLVNPRHERVAGRPCHASLADLPVPVDLVLLAVPDPAVEEQLALAARRGDRSAVLFGSAHEPPGLPQDQQPGQRPGQPLTLRARLAATARGAGMAVCGAGCMGFVNVTYGLRAVGYVEPDPLPRGPVALITHSGSVFSALLRTRRGLGFTIAVSSGQELVTTAAQYAEYALGLPETRVLALVLEAIREPGRLRAVLATARERGIPVVMLTAGRSAGGRALVSAHSGALAAADGGWEALAAAYGVHRVGDLAEMADTLEVFAAGRGLRPASPPPADPRDPSAPAEGSTPPGSSAASSRPPAASPANPTPTTPDTSTSNATDTPANTSTRASNTSLSGSTVRTGIATVHDSGLERAHVADVADELGVPFAAISEETTTRLAGLLDPGLEPANPLDVWGTGARAGEQLSGSLAALADDPAVRAVALAVDLVHEFDGDQSYPLAVAEAARRTSKPVVVLSNVPAAIDPDTAAALRAGGIPVLEGTRSGLLALKHLLDHDSADHDFPGHGFPGHGAGPEPSPPAAAPDAVPDQARRERWTRLITAGKAHGARLEDLLRDYGIAAARTLTADSDAGALAAAAEIGYPVVLKTGEPGIAHKSDAGGVVLGIGDPDALRAAYQDLAERLGRRVLICETIPAGPELSLGLARDHELGPLLVVGAGGVLVELLADRAVALPPVSTGQAHRILGTLRAARLLAGVRGQPAADLDAVVAAITGLSQLATELGDVIEALDINPLICGPARAVAVDALLIPGPG